MASYRKLFRVHPKEELAREFIRAFDSKDGGRDQDGIVTRAEFERAGGKKWSRKLVLLDTKTLTVPVPGKPGEVRRAGDGVVSMNDAMPVISAELESLTAYLDSLAPAPVPDEQGAPEAGERRETASEVPDRPKTTPEQRRDAVGRGRKLYIQHCAGCHGLHADGNGPVARFFHVRPRNFLRGEYKFRSTVTPDPPTDRDLFRTIRRGAGMSMPAWPHLGDAQVWDLVEYLKSNHPYYIPTELTVEDRFGAIRVAFLRWTPEQQADERLEGAQPDDASGFRIGNGRLQKRHGRWFWIQGGAPREVTDGLKVVTVLEGVQVTPILRLGKPVYDWMQDYDPHVRALQTGEAPIPYTKESAAIGKQVYAELGCATCHGAEGRGDGPGLESSRGSLGQLLLPTDFARPLEAFKGGSDDMSLVRTFLTGLAGTPMPSYSGNFRASLVAPPEKAPWHLAHYIQSLAGLPLDPE